MKTFFVNKTSWHYRLNVRMAKTNELLSQDRYAEKFVQSKDNLCSYWRMTSWSMIKVAASITFALAIILFVFYILYLIGYAFLFYTGQAVGVTVSLAILIALATLIGYVRSWVDHRKKIKLAAILHGEETETSLAKAKYSSWKSGICLPVEFSND